MSGRTQPLVKGIFSSNETLGHEASFKTYWFAKQIDKDTVSLTQLDADFLPTVRHLAVTMNVFMRGYVVEPDLSHQHLTQNIARGDAYREQGNNLEAKIEYLKVLRVDEENIRANFGLGLAYLGLSQLDKSRYVFTRLVGLDESFDAEHKHLFNEFGIGLRKKKLYDESLAFYQRAAALCPDDENIFLNMARAHFEKGDVENAFAGLKAALEIAPNFAEALIFFDFLKRHGHLPLDKDLAGFFLDLEG